MEHLIKNLNPTNLCVLLKKEGRIKNNHQTRTKKELLKKIQDLKNELSKLLIRVEFKMDEKKIIDIDITAKNWHTLNLIHSWYVQLPEQEIKQLSKNLQLKLIDIESYIWDCCEDCKSANVQEQEVPPQCEHSYYICQDCGKEWSEEG